MPSLAKLQHDFTRALRIPGSALPSEITGREGLHTHRRFGIYRNNHIVGLSNALGRSFPVVRKLVGDEFFDVAAREYVLHYPPHSPVLLLYGDQFGTWLEQLPGRSRFPYLGDLARLEWSRKAAFYASDAKPLSIRMLSEVPESELASLQLILHPSLQLLSSRWPVLSIWQDCTKTRHSGTVRMDQREQLMIIRPDDEILMQTLTDGHFTFLRRLSQGDPLGVAAGRAMDDHSEEELSALLASIFNSGAVVAISSPAAKTVSSK